MGRETNKLRSTDAVQMQRKTDHQIESLHLTDDKQRDRWTDKYIDIPRSIPRLIDTHTCT